MASRHGIQVVAKRTKLDENLEIGGDYILRELILHNYYEEKTNTFTLIEDWASLENYETYLQWRIDTGIADILNPLLVGGWDGVVSSVKRLGIPKGI